MLNIIEIDADDRIAAHVIFDHDDIDAAFEELDARYLAGEATAHAQYMVVSSRALSPSSIGAKRPRRQPDYVIIDHQLHNRGRVI